MKTVSWWRLRSAGNNSNNACNVNNDGGVNNNNNVNNVNNGVRADFSHGELRVKVCTYGVERRKESHSCLKRRKIVVASITGGDLLYGIGKCRRRHGLQIHFHF